MSRSGPETWSKLTWISYASGQEAELAGLYVYESQKQAIAERKIGRLKPVYGNCCREEAAFFMQPEADVHR
jgi:pyrroloquinoline quinone (PQQ) biosynthesis protein C